MKRILIFLLALLLLTGCGTKAPAAEAPTAEKPAEEIPVEEAPVEEVPVEETPAEEPAEEPREYFGDFSGKTITGEALCLIPQNGKERLCYEFAGTWEDGTYRLYLDAHTGEQAEILKIMTDAQGIWAA